MPTTVKSVAWVSSAHLAEVPLHAFPGAARGDAHGLVVIADAAARGEGIAQPVPVLLADLVGVVGEGGRSLVGGDHQVGIVAVEAHHLGRRHGLSGDEVVGEVQQPAQVVLIAGDAFLHERFAVGGRGAFFNTNPPLEPTGTITVFLTIWALTRPSTSVRKSSGRSDQRRPPRATLPPRRWMPSKRGE